MSMNVCGVIDDMSTVLKQNMNITISNQADKLNQCYNELDFLEEMVKVYPEMEKNVAIDVLNESKNDLLTSIIFSCEGFFRNSYICLRSSIELFLSFLYYFDHQYDYILWKNDFKDMKWSILSDDKEGVFNAKFYSVLVGKEVTLSVLKDRILELYHLCSQSVHGKYEYMQNIISPKIKYSDELFNDYYKLFCDIMEVLKVMLYLRFFSEFSNLLDQDDVQQLVYIIRKFEVLKYE